jgi:hypothetical protein
MTWSTLPALMEVLMSTTLESSTSIVDWSIFSYKWTKSSIAGIVDVDVDVHPPAMLEDSTRPFFKRSI